MKANIAVIILGIYIFAIGFWGLARTGSSAPLYINGAIAAVTVWLGWLLGTGMKSARNVTLTWLSINVVLLGYMTFDEISFNNDRDSGSGFMLGSMAAFALLTLYLVLRSGPRRRISNHRR